MRLDFGVIDGSVLGGVSSVSVLGKLHFPSEFGSDTPEPANHW